MLRPGSNGLIAWKRTDSETTFLIWLCIVVEVRVHPDLVIRIRILYPHNTAGLISTINPHIVTSVFDVHNGTQVPWLPISFVEKL